MKTVCFAMTQKTVCIVRLSDVVRCFGPQPSIGKQTQQPNSKLFHHPLTPNSMDESATTYEKMLSLVNWILSVLGTPSEIRNAKELNENHAFCVTK